MDTSASIGAPRDLRTNHAEENPNKILSKEKHVESEGFGSKELAGLLRTKRPHTYEEGSHVRGYSRSWVGFEDLGRSSSQVFKDFESFGRVVV
jgi:hypothetical protein